MPLSFSGCSLEPRFRVKAKRSTKAGKAALGTAEGVVYWAGVAEVFGEVALNIFHLILVF